MKQDKVAGDLTAMIQSTFEDVFQNNGGLK